MLQIIIPGVLVEFSVIQAVNNIHTFQQNYAANNECLGANQSGGFYSEDNSTTTAQSIDSTLNFCDITSFTEPNTVYGSVRYTASQYPSAKQPHN